MRPQAKRFTVEKKKTRRPRAHAQADLGLVGVMPKTSEPAIRSASQAAGDRLFRGMADPSDPRRSEYSVQVGTLLADTLASDQLGSNGAVEPPLEANRILPDLSWRDHLQGAGKDETSMVSKPRLLRRRKKQWREPQAKRGASGTRRPARPEALPIHPAAEKGLDEISIETPMSSGVADSATEPGGQRSVRPKRRQKWSPRELRRAVARGAIKISMAAARNRKRR